jgi:hypothetical protein
MCVNECKYESCFYSKTQENFYATKRKENFQTADEKMQILAKMLDAKKKTQTLLK